MFQQAFQGILIHVKVWEPVLAQPSLQSSWKRHCGTFRHYNEDTRENIKPSFQSRIKGKNKNIFLLWLCAQHETRLSTGGIVITGKGALQTERNMWANLGGMNQYHASGNLHSSKGPRGRGWKKWQWGAGAGLAMGSLFCSIFTQQYCFSFLSSYCLSFALNPNVSFFSSPQWSLLLASHTSSFST